MLYVGVVGYGKVRGKTVAEHRQPANGLGLGRLILEDVPVLGELAILDADNVGRDPCGGTAGTGEAPTRDHKIALSDDFSHFSVLGNERIRLNGPSRLELHGRMNASRRRRP
jgi:hypothetical protein